MQANNSPRLQILRFEHVYAWFQIDGFSTEKILENFLLLFEVFGFGI
jgi:hypothetical protein